jgi:2-oxoglutarate/2-oxoacid ferredoxin oxidoreductase subunit beta
LNGPPAPSNKAVSLKRQAEAHEKDEILTGVFYVDLEAPNFMELLNIIDEPLATLPESVTRPSHEVLKQCMEELM